jgi:Protein of unknown function (DUF2815)
MDTTFTLTHGVTLAFGKQLFHPKAYRDPKMGKEQGDPLYSAQFCFAAEHVDWQPIRKHVLRVAQAEWPGIKWDGFNKPFRDGSQLADKRKEENNGAAKKKPDMEFCRNHGVLMARSKYQPNLSYMERGMIVDCMDDQAKMRAEPKFFFGADVVATFNFRASEVRGQKSVAAYIQLVMATGKGKRLGGSRPGSEVFASMQGKETDEDPSDDGIPY